MDDELDIPEALEPMLGKGAINISYELQTSIPDSSVNKRVNHHFSHSDIGYKPITDDTFKLKARSRKYPVFGAFVGRVHVLQHFEGNRRFYRLEGLLEYRMSVLWFFAVLGFFFLLMYFSKAGLWEGALFEAISSGLTLFWTYNLGRNERDSVEEHVTASCVFLQTTIENMR